MTRMKIISRVMSVALMLALILTAALPALALAEPPLPHMFYGTVQVRHSAGGPLVPAPVGTKITAYASGGQGSWTVTVAGQYGNHPWQHLLVQGNISDGTRINFVAGAGYVAPQYGNYSAGAITQLNLTFNMYDTQPTYAPPPTTAPTTAPTTPPTTAPTSTAGPTGTPSPTSTGPTGTPSPTSTGPTGTPGPTGTVGPTSTPGPTTTPPPGTQSLTVGFWDTDNGGYGFVGSDGTVQVAVNAHSGDGTVSIEIPTGTEVLDSSGQPVDEITVGLETSTPPVPEGYFLIEAFDFGPDGATFSPSMEITIQYDLSELPAGQDPVIAYYNEAAGEWVFITGDVDTVNGTITFNIEHFTTFAVMGQGATPAGGEGIAWWIWLVIGLIALMAVVLVVLLLMRRRSAPVEVESDFNPEDDDF